MSHIVTIKTQTKDTQAIAAAAKRLGLPQPTIGATALFGVMVSGTIVRLKNWNYPIVINTQTGEIQYDNFNGCWGNIAQLSAFRQAYAIEKTRIEAARKGHTLTEQAQADGSVRLVITTR